MPADAPAPLTGSRLVLATVGLSLSNFMEVLDITIANVSIPSIAGDLGVSPNEGTWVLTSYAVANAITVMTAGWLARRYGQVRVFVAAVAVFTVASLSCAFAVSFPMLLAGRVVQGAVAGLMVPLSQALIVSIYPPQRRGLGLGIWAMTITVAPIVGPILGGWITDNIDWTWIFLLNIPIGAIAILLSWQTLGGRDAPSVKVPIDVVGVALIVAWVGALQIMLDKGNELDWFGSPFIIALAVISVVGFVLFVIWELTQEEPIVDLRLFATRSFSAATVAMMVSFALFFAGSVVLLPLWLQTSMGYTATWAGLAIAPGGILALLLSPVVGGNMKRVDPRWMVTFAFAVFAAISFMRAGFSTDSGFAALVLPQFLQGLATACFFTPLLAMAVADLRGDRLAVGSSLINFVRMIATSFGASLVVTVWDHRQQAHQVQLVEHAVPSAPAFQDYTHALATLGMRDAQVQAAAIAREIERQASTSALADIYWMSGWGFIAVAAVVWLCRRPSASGGGAAA